MMRLRAFLTASLVLAPSIVHAQTLLQQILLGLENAKDCNSCRELLVPIQELAKTGTDNFISNFTEICITAKLADPDVCAGDIAIQGPILAHDLQGISTNGTTAEAFCTAVFGLCPLLPVTPFNVKFPKPPPKHPKTFTSRGRKPFQFVHISDVHIDRNYTVGSNAICTKGICCRNFANETVNTTEPAGPFGNTHCDSPVLLAESMISAIKQLGSTAEFIISTGDIVDHFDWLESQSFVEGDLHDFDSMLARGLPNVVYGGIGNHDSFPTNAFARTTSHTANHSQFIFDLLGADFERWIGPVAANQLVHTSGSYAVVHPGTNLRLISINTQYWYIQNFWLYDSDEFQPDPNNLLEFMVQQLQEAEDAGQRAWIFGHVPPGHSDFARDQSNYYNQIVQRYKNTIAAQFFGHTHIDQLEIAYSDFSDPTAENAVGFGLIAPSLTPTSGNPAFKIFDIDPDTYEVMDMKVFTTNISSPTFQKKPTWELLYSARNSYGPLVGRLGPRDSLNASFWHKLTEAFETDDAAFQLYNARQSRDHNLTPCTGNCKNQTICDIRAMRAENNCDTISAGIQFRRSLDAPQIEQHTCEGNSIRVIMQGMLGATASALRSTLIQQ